jgi:O-antigen ligase
MSLVFVYYTMRLKPGVVFALILATAVAAPRVPQSFWDRMDSIFNPATDPSGSRQARVHLLNQGLQVFVANPITGVGAGQFVNYDGPEMIERWRVTHNVWLQMAAELGIFGLLLFGYLVYRGLHASFVTRRMLARLRRQMHPGGAPQPTTAPRAGRRQRGSHDALSTPPLTAEEYRALEINARGMFAALVGWLVCGMFASVAFNWTFYYVLALIVAGREIAVSRAHGSRFGNL